MFWFDAAGNGYEVRGTGIANSRMTDIACNPVTQHMYAAVSLEIQEFDAAGRIIQRFTGFGEPGQTLLVFDHAGDMFVASDGGKIFKNGAFWLHTGAECINDLAIGSHDRMYALLCDGSIIRIEPDGTMSPFVHAG